jgi:hypothetical protein
MCAILQICFHILDGHGGKYKLSSKEIHRGREKAVLLLSFDMTEIPKFIMTLLAELLLCLHITQK